MKTVEERITENIVDTLEQMTVLGGYENNYTVRRHRRIGDSLGAADITLIDGELTMNEQQSLGRDRWVKSYTVVVPVPHNDDSTVSEGDLHSRIQSDMIKALISTYTRGGLALDTRFASSSPIEDPNMAGTQFRFDVHFWTYKDDPYTQER